MQPRSMHPHRLNTHTRHPKHTHHSYAQRRKEVLEAAATVFADAAEEYATLDAVKRRLEEFKSAYPREYGSAYVGDSAPALFAPFVRLELLKWDPLFGGEPSEYILCV